MVSAQGHAYPTSHGLDSGAITILFFDFDFLIIPIVALALLAGGAASIIALALRSRSGGADPGIGTTRRIFLYGLAFAALITAASGWWIHI